MRAFRKGGLVPEEVPTLVNVLPDLPPAMSDEECVRILVECAREAGYSPSTELRFPEYVLAAMRRAQRHPAILDMMDAGGEFVRRVEAGEVRSKRTYERFKAALIALEGR